MVWYCSRIFFIDGIAKMTGSDIGTIGLVHMYGDGMLQGTMMVVVKIDAEEGSQ